MVGSSRRGERELGSVAGGRDTWAADAQGRSVHRPARGRSGGVVVCGALSPSSDRRLGLRTPQSLSAAWKHRVWGAGGLRLRTPRQVSPGAR